MPREKPSANSRIGAGIFVSGRVQGVGYRFFTERVAARHSILGWSRNLPDGRVELEIEAEEEDARKFIKELEKGPAMARVEEVNVDWKPCAGRFKNFTIRV